MKLSTENYIKNQNKNIEPFLAISGIYFLTKGSTRSVNSVHRNDLNDLFHLLYLSVDKIFVTADKKNLNLVPQELNKRFMSFEEFEKTYRE
ncbi:MAG: hypothetical protein HUK25_06395 [Treponema sp.]|nr:hypothetical protein [Treponema sp.]